jgi:hypothetical protein
VENYKSQSSFERNTKMKQKGIAISSATECPLTNLNNYSSIVYNVERTFILILFFKLYTKRNHPAKFRNPSPTSSNNYICGAEVPVEKMTVAQSIQSPSFIERNVPYNYQWSENAAHIHMPSLFYHCNHILSGLFVSDKRLKVCIHF